MHGRTGLYAIVDPDRCRGRDPRLLAEAILAAGCALLQLRSKGLSDAERLALGRELARRCERASVPFVMNDRVDLALLSGAVAAHLGQDDLPIPEARRLAPTLTLGLSTHDEAQAREAVRMGADYIGFGPIFPTTSKANPDPVVGLDRLAAVCRETPLPVVAIGGITVERTEAVAQAGAAFVAVISAITEADDPGSAAAAIADAFRRGSARPVR